MSPSSRQRTGTTEAGHDRAGRVGAVGGSGNEADVAVRLAARCVITANGEQAGVFALRAGVRLQRNRGEAGDLGQPVLRADRTSRDSPAVWSIRREGMKLRKLRPGDREHLRGRVQLHRAGAERDHRMAERKIARFEPAHVAQHLGLGVVRVEDRVGEKIGFAICDLRFAICRDRSRKHDAVFAEDVEEDLRCRPVVVVSSSEMPML